MSKLTRHFLRPDIIHNNIFFSYKIWFNIPENRLKNVLVILGKYIKFKIQFTQICGLSFEVFICILGARRCVLLVI